MIDDRYRTLDLTGPTVVQKFDGTLERYDTYEYVVKAWVEKMKKDLKLGGRKLK